jgi:hypothetical protein
MRIGRFTKAGRVVQQPGERIRRLFKYDRWLEDGERITAVAASIDETTTPPLVVDGIVIGPDADRFAYYTSGGVDGDDYVITFTITTSVGQTREDELLVGVREIARG